MTWASPIVQAHIKPATLLFLLPSAGLISMYDCAQLTDNHIQDPFSSVNCFDAFKSPFSSVVFDSVVIVCVSRS